MAVICPGRAGRTGGRRWRRARVVGVVSTTEPRARGHLASTNNRNCATRGLRAASPCPPPLTADDVVGSACLSAHQRTFATASGCKPGQRGVTPVGTATMRGGAWADLLSVLGQASPNLQLAAPAGTEGVPPKPTVSRSSWCRRPSRLRPSQAGGAGRGWGQGRGQTPVRRAVPARPIGTIEGPRACWPGAPVGLGSTSWDRESPVSN